MERNPTFAIGGAAQVSDLVDHSLITDSSEVQYILDNYVPRGKRMKYATLFVLIGDGDYKKIWGCSQSVPLTRSVCFRIA